jgi:hypothetical protein
MPDEAQRKTALIGKDRKGGQSAAFIVFCPRTRWDISGGLGGYGSSFQGVEKGG